jgi:hypothetical protein
MALLFVTHSRTYYPMSWPDTPFGLEHWATHNVQYVQPQQASLRSVLRAKELDRPFFHTVVALYGEVITALKEAYIWLNPDEMIRMHIPYQNVFPRVDNLLGIPMRLFQGIRLPEYKLWYYQLMSLASILQDETATYYFSGVHYA